MAAYLEVIDSIAILRLPSSGRLNAMGPREVQDLTSTLSSIREADHAALVLTGDTCFSAGLDLAGLLEMSRRQERSQIVSWLSDSGTAIRLILEQPSPTLAAVDGAIGGIGLALAIACDLRFFGPGAHVVPSPDPFGAYSTVGCSLISARTSATTLANLITPPFAITSELAAIGLGVRAKESAITSAIQTARTLATLPIGARRSFDASNRALSIETLLKFAADPQSEVDFILSAEFRSSAEVALAGMEEKSAYATFGALEGLYPPAQDA